ncbi:MAG: MmcQ/YjbR family DNA-binding protein [Deinococcus sp.]
MQTAQHIRDTCARLPGSRETFPFGLDTLALKVGGRTYALLALNDDLLTLSLKCDPWRAEELRREHPGIAPGYHLSKRHWNTLALDGGLPDWWSSA